MCDDFEIDVEHMKRYVYGDGPIIVVDDDRAQLMLVSTCYKKCNRKNELICLQSGEEFLQLIENTKEDSSSMPELVLLDINMPKLSGFDVLKRIRNLDDFKEVPVIVMFTTSDSEQDKERAKELHANAYLSKPAGISKYIQFFQSV